MSLEKISLLGLEENDKIRLEHSFISGRSPKKHIYHYNLFKLKDNTAEYYSIEIDSRDDWCHYSNLFHVETDVGVFDVNEIPTVECHGDRCRKSFTFKERGEWCISCHGDPSKSLDLFIKEELVVGDLNPACIKSVKRLVFPNFYGEADIYDYNNMKSWLEIEYDTLKRDLLEYPDRMRQNMAQYDFDISKNIVSIGDEENVMKHYIPDNLHEILRQAYTRRLEDMRVKVNAQLYERNEKLCRNRNVSETKMCNIATYTKIIEEGMKSLKKQ